MTHSKTKATQIERLQTDVLQAGRTEILSDLVHEDVRVSDVAFEGAYEGIDQYVGHVEMIRSAFDDIDTTFEIMVEGEDSVTVEYTVEANHGGAFMGIEGTGNDISFSGIDVYTFEDGRISEIRGCFTLFGLLEDMGMVSSPFEG